MMKKKWLVTILFSSLCITSVFYSFSIVSEGDYNIYTLSDDVMPFVFPEGSGTNWWDYRFNNGIWETHYPGNGNNTWTPNNGVFYISDMLNNMGVASLSDVSTYLTGSLDSVFGPNISWPLTMNLPVIGNNGTVQRNYKNYMDLFQAAFSMLLTSQVLYPNEYFIDYDGTVTQNKSNMASANVISHNFVGLNKNLENWIYHVQRALNADPISLTYNGLSETGGLTSYSSHYLQGLNSGMAGVGSLLRTNTSVIRDFSSTNHDDLENVVHKLWAPFGSTVQSKEYEVGAVGNGINRTWSSMGHLQSVMLSDLNRTLISWHQSLYWDGTTDLNPPQANYGLADITADGFVGLASILRGVNDGSPLLFTYTRRNWRDNTEVENSYNNFADFLLNPLDDIQDALASYLYSHGTDLDIDIRDNMGDQADQFVGDFTSPDGKGTPSAGQIGDVANVSGAVGDLGDNDASVADVFNQLGDDDNYSFFSASTQQELNPMYGQRALSDDGYVDFLDSHVRDFYSKVGSSW